MLSQSQSSLNHIDFQARFDHQRAQFKILIDRFAPCWFTDRRNGNNTKLADEDLLALMCLKVHYQLTTWMALYRLVKHALLELAMIEYSCFTRRIKQLGPVLQAIRQGLLSWTTPGSIAIIDSYPLPLCQYVRNFHACAFAGYADIGYNATKKQHFYGLKLTFRDFKRYSKRQDKYGFVRNFKVYEANAFQLTEAARKAARTEKAQRLRQIYVNGTWNYFRSMAKTALQSEAGYALYRRRKYDVEPVFARLKQNLGYRRTNQRGTQAVKNAIGLALMSLNLTRLADWALQRQ